MFLSDNQRRVSGAAPVQITWAHWRLGWSRLLSENQEIFHQQILKKVVTSDRVTLCCWPCGSERKSLGVGCRGVKYYAANLLYPKALWEEIMAETPEASETMRIMSKKKSSQAAVTCFLTTRLSRERLYWPSDSQPPQAVTSLVSLILACWVLSNIMVWRCSDMRWIKLMRSRLLSGHFLSAHWHSAPPNQAKIPWCPSHDGSLEMMNHVQWVLQCTKVPFISMLLKWWRAIKSVVASEEAMMVINKVFFLFKHYKVLISEKFGYNSSHLEVLSHRLWDQLIIIIIIITMASTSSQMTYQVPQIYTWGNIGCRCLECFRASCLNVEQLSTSAATL